MFAHTARWAAVLVALSPIATAAPPAYEIKQHFPADKPAAGMQTQWRVVWGVEKHAGGSEVLFIEEAYFTRAPGEKEIKVLGDCRLAEVFVPYNHPSYRIYDISGESFSLVPLDKSMLGPTCVAGGKIYNAKGMEADGGPVAAEVHDGQIRWMNYENTVRRGQSLSVWAVLSAGNYRYVMLYQFRDDGQVGFRIGATAHNFFSDDGDLSAHVHMGCWRVNVELGAADKTKVSQVTLNTTAGKTVAAELKAEARIKWNAEEFTRLRVESTEKVNGHVKPHPIGYELIPMRMGSPRYGGDGEEFTQHDLWVTRRKTTVFEQKPVNLNAIENGEGIVGEPVTLWHHTTALHAARDEDFGKVGTDQWAGVAITTWSGFDLKPRNFFASTPLYP
jgi:hypothetical protein